ncbi:MAG: hypothetical protein M9890_05720 [Thermomicrobiales bacterium]|nr:hypothetical protein [Thermomicrobiales bacterium]
MSANDTVPDFVTRWPNLAQPRLGAEVISATDEFFAAKERMIQAEPPVRIPGKFDDHGGWMDGWETRRKRGPGYDHCVVRLGRVALLYGVDIDTSYFTGNFPPSASIDGRLDGEWTEIVPPTNLGGNAHHYVEVEQPGPWRELRLNIYPDGGVARQRVHGRFVFDAAQESGDLVELSGLMQGGRPVAWSDAHYGWPGKVFLPDRGINMGDGWETSRRRVPGNEWLIAGTVIPARSSRSRPTPPTRATTRTRSSFRQQTSSAQTDTSTSPRACSGQCCCRQQPGASHSPHVR